MKFFIALTAVVAFAAVLTAQDKPAPKLAVPVPAKVAPKEAPTAGVDIPDPTDGGTYRNVPPGLVEAVKARIAARQRGEVPPTCATGTCPTGNCPTGRCGVGVGVGITVGPVSVDISAGKTGTDLDELNGQRAQRGLPPYQMDPALTQAATAAANYRASRCIEGHCNDFSFLPAGTHAAAAGCAAWQPGTGFGACAMYEHYKFAGAASAIGADGRRYMHLFVR